jgi:hypothetical protein
VTLAQLHGCADTFVRVRRRHANVGDHDVRQFTLDGRHELRRIARDCRNDVPVLGEQPH